MQSGPTWHGSGPNTDKTRVRRSLAIHFLPSHATFQPTGVGVRSRLSFLLLPALLSCPANGACLARAQYIYGRYKKWGSVEMEETFFPITYRHDGYRSPFLASYCSTTL